MINLPSGKDRYSRIPEPIDPDHSRGKNKWEKLQKEKSEHKFTSGYNHIEVKKALRLYHGDKCVYCESVAIGVASYRVDHYRPKAKVKGDDSGFSGYFWLGYEWSNLLQSCEACNGIKSNYFPLGSSENRVVWENPESMPPLNDRLIIGHLLSGEKRMLLNPELDDVERHLRFRPDGSVIGLTEEGKASIRFYGLNRHGLLVKRKQVIDNFFYQLVGLLDDYESRLIIPQQKEMAGFLLGRDLSLFFERMLLRQDPREEYSRLGFFLFHDFESFFLDRLPEEIEEHIILVRKFFLYLTPNA